MTIRESLMSPSHQSPILEIPKWTAHESARPAFRRSGAGAALRDADDGRDGLPREKYGVVGHMDTDRFCTDRAAEIRLLRDRPVPVAGGEAPDRMLSASRGLSLDQGIDLISEVLDGSGRGGIKEKPL